MKTIPAAAFSVAPQHGAKKIKRKRRFTTCREFNKAPLPFLT
jgi:hypothetical protein